MRRVGIDFVRKRLNAIRLRRKIRQEAIEAYGGKCVRCGFSDARALQIDHIEGNGCAHRKSLGGQVAFMFWLRRNNFPPEFQLLCANCNWTKRAEDAEDGRVSVGV
jgi:hypothetical protein